MGDIEWELAISSHQERVQWGNELYLSLMEISRQLKLLH